MAASNSKMESLSSEGSLPAQWAADDVEKRERLRTTMEAAGITAVSIATVAGGKVSSLGEFPVPDSVTGQSSAVNQDTVFGAVSLSKPLFSYLVLTLRDWSMGLVDFNLNQEQDTVTPMPRMGSHEFN